LDSTVNSSMLDSDMITLLIKKQPTSELI